MYVRMRRPLSRRRVWMLLARQRQVRWEGAFDFDWQCSGRGRRVHISGANSKICSKNGTFAVAHAAAHCFHNKQWFHCIHRSGRTCPRRRAHTHTHRALRNFRRDHRCGAAFSPALVGGRFRSQNLPKISQNFSR